MLLKPALLALLALPLCAFAHSGHHHGHNASHASETSSPATAPEGVRVQDCWIRTMPPQVPSGGYFIVHNDTDHPVSLTGIASPAFAETMLHQTVTRDGMARMMHIDAVEVPARGNLAFKPGSYHAMLEKPTQDLQIGSTVAVKLMFGAAGTVSTDCTLRAPATVAG